MTNITNVYVGSEEATNRIEKLLKTIIKNQTTMATKADLIAAHEDMKASFLNISNDLKAWAEKLANRADLTQGDFDSIVNDAKAMAAQAKAIADTTPDEPIVEDNGGGTDGPVTE